MRAVLPRLQPGRRQPLPIETIAAHPLLAALHGLWSRGCGAGGLPEQLDPLEIPRRLLPYIMLLDIETAPKRLRIRLAGTRLCEAFGGEMRGLTLEDLFEDTGASDVLAHTSRLIDQAGPNLARQSQRRSGAGTWHYTRLILPLAQAGRRVGRLLFAIDPETFRHEHATPEMRERF